VFTLHPTLEKDTIKFGELPLCHVLLMNDANYPWFILVPKRPNIQEIFEMKEADQAQLLKESSYISQQLAEHFNADKLNIAALGNIVPQLHLHHIVRYTNDPAWPAPVWGKLAARPYTEEKLHQLSQKLKEKIKPYQHNNIEWHITSNL